MKRIDVPIHALVAALALVFVAPHAAAQDEEPGDPPVELPSDESAPSIDAPPVGAEDTSSETSETPDTATPETATPETATPETATPEAASEPAASEPIRLLEGERRAVPDLDGRPDPGLDPADAALWVPRIVFAPFYLLAEYVLRRPIGWFLTTAERERWDLLQFAGRPPGALDWGLVPTVLIDFGFRPAAGLYVWLNNAGFRGHSIRMRVGFGGLDWLRATIVDRIHFDARTNIQAYFSASTRPDNIFVGFGPSDAFEARQSRYARERLEGALTFTYRPWRASHIRITAGVHTNHFYDPGEVDPPEQPTGQAARQGLYPSLGTSLPPGYDGYLSAWQRIDGSVDTRLPGLGQSRSGVRAEAFAEVEYDLVRPLERRWMTYGGGVGGYVDVHAGRTLGLWVATELATPFGSEPIPFTELPDLGLRGRMAGFRRGWITGPSAISASLEYRYPIWAALDGFVSVATGNAFGPELRDFDFEDLRMSFMLGLRTIGDPDHAITLQIGFGTRTFAQGLDPESLRFTIGTQEGF